MERHRFRGPSPNCHGLINTAFSNHHTAVPATPAGRMWWQLALPDGKVADAGSDQSGAGAIHSSSDCHQRAPGARTCREPGSGSIPMTESRPRRTAGRSRRRRAPIHIPEEAGGDVLLLSAGGGRRGKNSAGPAVSNDASRLQEAFRRSRRAGLARWGGRRKIHGIH